MFNHLGLQGDLSRSSSFTNLVQYAHNHADIPTHDSNITPNLQMDTQISQYYPQQLSSPSSQLYVHPHPHPIDQQQLQQQLQLQMQLHNPQSQMQVQGQAQAITRQELQMQMQLQAQGQPYPAQSHAQVPLQPHPTQTQVSSYGFNDPHIQIQSHLPIYSEPKSTRLDRPSPTFVCRYCQKISESCYFCYGQPCNFERKLQQFRLYNEPNNFSMQEVVEHCDKRYIYEENVDNTDKIYDPYITRCKIDDDVINGRKTKKDHPGFCKYCTLIDDRWDSNFYERNNSRYRGHMINTHGIHPNGNVAKMPESGMFCYKWIRNHWFETSGFICPYGCGENFTIGEKGHGFHEYLRHWSKYHANNE